MVLRVCLLRHGASTWNIENVFTGWTDVDLADSGRLQAIRAGNLLKAHNYHLDLAFTSVLKRAIHTLELTLDEMDLAHLPVVRSWRLNERHYGALQGLNKAQMAQQYGEEQVHLWRRSYNVQPPPLDECDPRHPVHDDRYTTHITTPTDPVTTPYLPATESLKDCITRTLPFWHTAIAPAIKAGRSVIVAAHGNSLRGIVKYLDHISEQAIADLEIPVGTPLVYELDEHTLRPLRHYYLGEPQVIGTQGGAHGELLVGPSSWGLVTPVGCEMMAWLRDLQRVGLVKSHGCMQYTGTSGADQASSPVTGSGTHTCRGRGPATLHPTDSVRTVGHVSVNDQQDVLNQAISEEQEEREAEAAAAWKEGSPPPPSTPHTDTTTAPHTGSAHHPLSDALHAAVTDHTPPQVSGRTTSGILEAGGPTALHDNPASRTTSVARSHPSTASRTTSGAARFAGWVGHSGASVASHPIVTPTAPVCPELPMSDEGTPVAVPVPTSGVTSASPVAVGRAAVAAAPAGPEGHGEKLTEAGGSEGAHGGRVNPVLRDAVCLDDLAAVMQHSRFLVVDVSKVVSKESPDNLGPALSSYLGRTLAQLKPHLDPSQHTLLLVTEQPPHIHLPHGPPPPGARIHAVPPRGTGDGGDRAHEDLTEMIAAQATSQLKAQGFPDATKVLVVSMAPATPTATEVSLMAAKAYLERGPLLTSGATSESKTAVTGASPSAVSAAQASTTSVSPMATVAAELEKEAAVASAAARAVAAALKLGAPAEQAADAAAAAVAVTLANRTAAGGSGSTGVAAQHIQHGQHTQHGLLHEAHHHEGATVLPLSTHSAQDVRRVVLMLQYTGRPVTAPVLASAPHL